MQKHNPSLTQRVGMRRSSQLQHFAPGHGLKKSATFMLTVNNNRTILRPTSPVAKQGFLKESKERKHDHHRTADP